MFLPYTTSANDRWDLIAYQMYGDVHKMSMLIEVNNHVPIYDVFPAGVLLNIPVLNTEEIIIDSAKLPPWKRI